MTTDTDALDAVAADRPLSKGPPREVIYRHTFLVRLTHWLNALAIFILIGSGLNIFNAHPHLYWGMWGSDVDGHPFFSIDATGAGKAVRGMTTIGPLHLDTTGFLGWSKTGGAYAARGWPELADDPRQPGSRRRATLALLLRLGAVDQRPGLSDLEPRPAPRPARPCGRPSRT